MDEARRALDELILARKGCTYSGISRLLGRNVSYIQQYIRKGSPRYLDESDRNILARFFGVDERVLGAPPHRSSPVVELVQIPVLDVEASAGHGALAEMENKSAQFRFDEGCRRTPAMPCSEPLTRPREGARSLWRHRTDRFRSVQGRLSGTGQQAAAHGL